MYYLQLLSPAPLEEGQSLAEVGLLPELLLPGLLVPLDPLPPDGEVAVGAGVAQLGRHLPTPR